MNLTKTKPSRAKKSKQKRRLTPEEAFQKEWQRVINFQKSNAKLKQDVEAFVAQVEDYLGAEETLLCDAQIEQTRKLIGFIAKKTLPDYLRDELLFWIETNLDKLTNNPFTQNHHLQSLMEEFESNLKQHDQHELEKFKKRYPDLEPEDDLEDEDELEDIVKSLFEDMDEDWEGPGDDNWQDDPFGNPFEDQYEEEIKVEQHRAMDKLLKSSSINQLFRRLAKALHPDMVQDEEEKTKRHHLMSELVEARKKKDIVTIMTMYAEHIGEAPQDIFQNNFEQMTQLLKFRVAQLKEEKDHIIHENPRHGCIYSTFHHPSNSKVQQALRARQKAIKSLITDIKITAPNLSSLKALKPLLRDRYEESDVMGEFAEFLMRNMDREF